MRSCKGVGSLAGRAVNRNGETNDDAWGVGSADSALRMGEPCTWGSG
ncbi:hypothetical protein SAMN05216326_12436 [Nitrosomonas marina]|uniref:Uncharacterized protein n=1 Tax=Nitrosomonas marina TaxID=917 RepID=A0A1I0E3B1_9PROT|nr:hypothetical protein [Nitrosomonas marina]SET39121.1 hypothetical protein SAMN05216326_12436 [Nitrosomonas marina]